MAEQQRVAAASTTWFLQPTGRHIFVHLLITHLGIEFRERGPEFAKLLAGDAADGARALFDLAQGSISSTWLMARDVPPDARPAQRFRSALLARQPATAS
jgi:hypothetical protein